MAYVAGLLPVILRAVFSGCANFGEFPLEHKNHDKVFFINFSVVLGILGAIALVIAGIARVLNPHSDEPSKEQLAALNERIKPVTQVISDPDALLKVTAKPARAPLTGEQIVAQVCTACHGSGVLNAPKIGDAGAWKERLAAQGGLEGITAAAIKGIRSMPARGGDPDLSDAEVHSAVEHMLKQSGV